MNIFIQLRPDKTAPRLRRDENMDRKIEKIGSFSVSKPKLNQELSYDEARELLRLERLVERAFYQAGKALSQIRDRKLYRANYETFEQYCRERFNYHRSHSYRLIDAAEGVENILGKCPPMGDIEQEENKSLPILPTSERQVRPLIGLNPSQQKEVWLAAITKAKHKVPSGKIVKEVKESIYPNPTQELKVAHHLKLKPRGLIEINQPGCVDFHQRYGRIYLTHKNQVEVWLRNPSNMMMEAHTFKLASLEGRSKKAEGRRPNSRGGMVK